MTSKEEKEAWKKGKASREVFNKRRKRLPFEEKNPLRGRIKTFFDIADDSRKNVDRIELGLAEDRLAVQVRWDEELAES